MENKYKYVLSLFNQIYHLETTAYELSYGIDEKSKIQIKKGKVTFFDKHEEYNIRNVIWKEWNSVQIPFLFDERPDTEILTFSNGRVIINFDIIASSFFFLSSWQELSYNKGNDLCRFPFEASIQYKLKIIDKPIVNYYFEILKEAIERAYSIKLKVSLWQDKPFAAFISHDIDTCQSAWIQGSFRALLKGDIPSILKLLWLKTTGNDAWFNFDHILESERKDHIHSTFFFMSRKGKYGKFRNSDYNINNRKFRKVFDRIRENHSEVGLHGSLGTSHDLNRYEEDVRQLKFKITGNRFHFLEFDTHNTLEILEKSGIAFDSTLGFAEHYGFRNGICFPFFLYDVKNDKQSKILEIPLVLMDGTLQNTKYMNLGNDQIETRLNELVKEVKKFNGLITILWHNTHYSEYKYKGWGRIMEKIIRICTENDSLFLNGSEIVQKYGNMLSST